MQMLEIVPSLYQLQVQWWPLFLSGQATQLYFFFNGVIVFT